MFVQVADRMVCEEGGPSPPPPPPPTAEDDTRLLDPTHLRQGSRNLSSPRHLMRQMGFKKLEAYQEPWNEEKCFSELEGVSVLVSEVARDGLRCLRGGGSEGSE